MQYLTPHPGFSKEAIFYQKENELHHVIKHAEKPEKIIKTAEKLRFAKLQLLKAYKKAINPYCDDDSNDKKRLNNVIKETEVWANLSVEEIIEKYTNINTEQRAP